MPWIAALDPAPLAERLALAQDTPVLVVLPGSRSSEVSRLMRPFGEALAVLLAAGTQIRGGDAGRCLRCARSIEQHLTAWPKRPHLVEGEEDKFRAFKLARAALAASGTVTLELALAGTPMVVGYKVDAVIAPVLRRLIIAPSVVLPNLVLGEKAFPEFHPGELHGRRTSPTPWRRCWTTARSAPGNWRRWRRIPAALQVVRPRRRARRRPISCWTTRRTAAAGRAIGAGRRQQLSRRSAALLDRHERALGGADVELARTADLLLGVLDHLFPLRDPADRARHREQHA